MNFLFSKKMKINRLRELDFLRGIAIILVLLRHQVLFDFTTEMGWIGVDLFFILSGFLVSGLLFKEYKKFGNIEPMRFLIRRGFKIYPIYYISILIYMIPFLVRGDLPMRGLLYELTFIQNYTKGFGYLNPVSWSLAIEEHFYIGLVIILWISLKKKWIKLEVEDTNVLKFGRIEGAIFSLFILCFLARIHYNILHHELLNTGMAMTHLRIDSLFAGVLISYFYHFKISYLNKIMEYKWIMFAAIIIGVIWTPFINNDISFFARTGGFVLLYISFSLLLIYFIMKENINVELNRIFSSFIVDILSKIGSCSYSIYIFHIIIGGYAMSVIDNMNLPFYNHRVNFVITSFFSILIGILITNTVEKFFLKIRDRKFPNRIQ